MYIMYVHQRQFKLTSSLISKYTYIYYLPYNIVIYHIRTKTIRPTEVYNYTNIQNVFPNKYIYLSIYPMCAGASRLPYCPPSPTYPTPSAPAPSQTSPNQTSGRTSQSPYQPTNSSQKHYRSIFLSKIYIY